ncbi:MAG: uroporphyrinogen-III C-methyltransferase [Desulfobacteraceae bacterium 4484_190.1]|nr:MAG: uroporphyrinogen-III C-methyltransferase [Desulfobacteraceae bacterium 4484_190.1]
MAKPPKGKVFLVGAGPGDPDLLTVKGKECISEADVVVYDYLANKVLLEYAKDDAEIIYAGKKGGCHTMSQEDISSMIVKKAKMGRTVVRLKGGDPFIFGRGGEEAQQLVRAGVAFEVVPGVTSAIAVPAYAGIPLTHRDYTSTVAFITGHEEPGKKESDIAWEKLSTGAGTLVFLMGVGNLPLIAERLMHYGRPPDTPAAVIRRGTVSEQRTVAGTLKNIAELIREKDIKPPAIIIIGDVVNLRTELDWFEKRPLFGKRIVVTRAREQASAFLKKLTGLGAECIEFPTIKIVPPRTWDMLDKSIKSINNYDWLLFTSVNGVKYFFNRLDTLGKDVRDLHGLKIGAIGPKTAGELQNFGIKPELMPDEYRAEAVVASFEKYGVRGAKILVPRAAVAREILPDELKKIGAEVDVAPAYETVIPDHDSGWIREMLEKGDIDMVTFTSSSTVNNFVEALKADDLELQKSMENVVVACIGPITADTARKNGLNADLVPSDYTIEGLTGEIINYFSS